MTDKVITSQCLYDVVQALHPTGRLWVGYSGGIDSHVLLHLAASLKDDIEPEVSAIHVDHGISLNSVYWGEHCRNVCNQLDISITNIKIDGSCPAGESLENWARQQRYAAITSLVEMNDVILMAHNRDDQAETVLLQILRGSGPRGLAAMPFIRRFEKGWLARPLLDFSRKQIRNYALSHKLEWIDDESNADPRFDRNYLRLTVMPILEERWPGQSRVISRVAGHQSRIIELLDEIAANDLKYTQREDTDALDIGAMESFSETRIKNLIIHWLKQRGMPTPGPVHLEHILSDIIHSSADTMPCVRWKGTEMRRYRDMLFAHEPLPDFNPDPCLYWDMSKPLTLDTGILEAEKGRGRGISIDKCQDGVIEVKFRKGGERLQPAGRRETHELKKLFQEHGILPWLRDRIPLLYVRGKLAAVADLWIDREFSAAMEQESWQIEWKGKWNIFYDHK